MWYKTKMGITLSLLLALCFCVPCAGSCSQAAAGTTEETLTVSKKDWERLKANNDAQAKALNESQAELNAVKQAQAESERALSEAKILLETSQMTSDEMTKLCATLLNELNLQKAENAKLMQELKDAKAESLTAYEAISNANQYLQDMKAEIEANEATWRRREAQLERQRFLWQIISVACAYGGYAIAK